MSPPLTCASPFWKLWVRPVPRMHRAHGWVVCSVNAARAPLLTGTLDTPATDPSCAVTFFVGVRTRTLVGTAGRVVTSESLVNEMHGVPPVGNQKAPGSVQAVQAALETPKLLVANVFAAFTASVKQGCREVPDGFGAVHSPLTGYRATAAAREAASEEFWDWRRTSRACPRSTTIEARTHSNVKEMP